MPPLYPPQGGIGEGKYSLRLLKELSPYGVELRLTHLIREKAVNSQSVCRLVSSSTCNARCSDVSIPLCEQLRISPPYNYYYTTNRVVCQGNNKKGIDRCHNICYY